VQLGGLDAEPEQDTPLFRSRIAQFERRSEEIKARLPDARGQTLRPSPHCSCFCFCQSETKVSRNTAKEVSRLLKEIQNCDAFRQLPGASQIRPYSTHIPGSAKHSRRTFSATVPEVLFSQGRWES
jgi:hypothetical protein